MGKVEIAMCLAVPGKILSIQDYLAVVDVRGVLREASIMLLPEVKVGQYVLVHAGFVIQTMEEKDAAETIALFEELERYEREA